MNEPNTFYIQVSDSDDQTQWEPISTILSEILAGMFDFQIAEDAQIARDTLAANKNRARPWRS